MSWLTLFWSNPSIYSNISFNPKGVENPRVWRGAYSFACLRHSTTNHASRPRRREGGGVTVIPNVRCALAEITSIGADMSKNAPCGRCVGTLDSRNPRHPTRHSARKTENCCAVYLCRPVRLNPSVKRYVDASEKADKQRATS